MRLTVLVMPSVPPFEPRPTRLMYEQVAEHVAARIETGELRPGQKMPPERDLATEYGVAYNTVRAAMGILRDRGLIVTMHGRGTYVAEHDEGPPPPQ
jgi:DNA-binding GntR family transcriptional regulator